MWDGHGRQHDAIMIAPPDELAHQRGLPRTGLARKKDIPPRQHQAQRGFLFCVQYNISVFSIHIASQPGCQNRLHPLYTIWILQDDEPQSENNRHQHQCQSNHYHFPIHPHASSSSVYSKVPLPIPLGTDKGESRFHISFSRHFRHSQWAQHLPADRIHNRKSSGQDQCQLHHSPRVVNTRLFFEDPWRHAGREDESNPLPMPP